MPRETIKELKRQLDELMDSNQRVNAYVVELENKVAARDAEAIALLNPIPLVLTCPACGARHIDKGAFATKPHHTHACQGCGLTWRPAIVPTVGVQFLPGFKDSE